MKTYSYSYVSPNETSTQKLHRYEWGALLVLWAIMTVIIFCIHTTILSAINSILLNSIIRTMVKAVQQHLVECTTMFNMCALFNTAHLPVLWQHAKPAQINGGTK